MKKAGPVLAIIILVASFGIAAFVGGRMVYLNKNPHIYGKSDSLSEYKSEWVATKIVSAYTEPICEIKHTFSYVIPTGTEYYYMALTEDNVVIVIRAGKKWLEKNFDADGNPKNGPLALSGYVRKLSDDPLIVVRKIKLDVRFEKEYFLDADGFLNGILLLIFGLLPVVMGAVIGVLYKAGVLNMELHESGAKIFFIIFFVLIIGEIGLMLHVFSMF